MLDISNHYHVLAPSQNQNFLDLGGVLAAVGLLGIVYQFQTPFWALVLKIRGGDQKSLIWILSGLGLFIMLPYNSSI